MRTIFGKVSFSFLCILFLLATNLFGQNMFRKVNDFDGDGKADFVVTRDVGGARYWYIWQTRNGFRAFRWGVDIDQNAAGDYDGDGKTDFAVYRKVTVAQDSSRHSWWIYGSQSGEQSVFWNWNDPISVVRQQDYDGDGKTDIAFSYGDNQSTMQILFSGGGGAIRSVPGGSPIKLGDMTGDTKADVAGYNSTTNIVSIRNSATNALQTIPFGLADDVFVPADFDGDGKGDLTVFRQSDGTWWWIKSSDNTVNAVNWGAVGDVPVPADYDGDGKTDLAIWRPGSQSNYWVYGSQSGPFVFGWGISSDTVVRY